MLSKDISIMESVEAKLLEMLEIGMHLGTGPLYLLYYYGQLAITNNAGLLRWPEGPKVIVAVIEAQECSLMFRSARKAYLLKRLRSHESFKDKQR